MSHHPFFLAAALSMVAACSSSSPSPIAPAPAPAPAPPHTLSADAAVTSCTSSTFVACESGPACARRQGTLVNPHPCYEHAATACDSLSCTYGCSIHHGTPKEIHCSPNASSGSHMKRCGGLANWACPENMECEFAPDAHTIDDAMGTCVSAAKRDR